MSDHLLLIGSLLVAGYLLLALEAFVIPGFGLAGISGMAALAAGCLFAFRWFEPVTATTIVGGVVATTSAFLWWVPRSAFGKDVVHQGSLGGAHASEARIGIGRRGVAESDLRPSGVARFGDQRESVLTDGDFVSRGQAVRVVEVRGSRVVVEIAPDDNGSEADPQGGA
jgi:membrane-bound serine protease (ClpP class)